LKIVHVVLTLDPAGGGPPQVAVRLAAAQAALGHDVHIVFYATAAAQPRVDQQLARVPHREKLCLHPVPDPGRYARLLGRSGRRTLRETCRDASFVHIHGVWGGLLRAAADVARDARVPYCFRPAGMLDPWCLAQKAWNKKLALALGYRAALNGASFIHTLNDDEKRLIGPLRLEARSIVMANGVFIEEIAPLPSPGTFRSSRPALAAAPFILFLSRLHHKKGLDLLVNAFAILASVHRTVRLVVAGPDDGAGGDLAAQVAATGLGDRVDVIGPLYGRAKIAALVDAACFCLPSRQEGFSVAVLEAMACAVPVVISEACHFPEVAEVGAGTIVPLDAPALAKALGDVVADPGNAARMGAAGAALVRSRYTWEAIAGQSLRFYQEASGRSPASRPGA